MNLNDYRYKDRVDEELIFKYITDYDVFNTYIEGLELGKAFHSPLREDNHPSFTVFYSRRYNKYMFKDFRLGSGDCVVFVQKLLNLNKYEALVKIIQDFNLEDKFEFKPIEKSIRKFEPVITKGLKPNLGSTKIQIKKRQWSNGDILYWKQYNVSIEILELFKAVPISYYFINNHPIKSRRLSYAYREFKDGELRYKIYQPEGDRTDKWFSNFVYGTLSGWRLLPEKGDLLIITSSLKDGLCLYSHGFNILAPQTENYIFKKNVIEDLQNRFNRILVWYDHDDAGFIAAKKMKELYGLDYITTGFKENKDPSDLYKYNKEEFLNIINSLR